MNNSSSNASSSTKRGNSEAVSYARFGSNSYIVYESKFLDLDVKFADVNGTNLFHVKSFVESYNKVNDEPIIDFADFITYHNDRYSTISEYLKYAAEFYNDTSVGSDPTDLFDSNNRSRRSPSAPEGDLLDSKKRPVGSNPDGLLDSNNRWNIPYVIQYCYSNLDDTRGYWCCGEILSRYAQRGNQRFAFMVDHLIAAIATFNEQKMNEALKCLTLDKEKMQKRIEYFKTECNHMTNYMKPEIGKDYVAYVEWIANKNELYIGSMDKKKFLNIRAKKDEQGNPLRYFIYAKDNKFGIQLRDLYRDCLIDLFGDMIRVNKCHLTFIPKVNLNNIQWRVRNCMQRIRVAATVPEV